MSTDPNNHDDFYTQWVKNKLKADEERRQKALVQNAKTANEPKESMPGWQQRSSFGRAANQDLGKQELQNTPPRVNLAKYVRRFANSENQPIVPQSRSTTTELWQPNRWSKTLSNQNVTSTEKTSIPIIPIVPAVKSDQAAPLPENALPVAPQPPIETKPENEEIYTIQEPETYYSNDLEMEDDSFEDISGSNYNGSSGNNGNGGNNGGGGTGANDGDDDNRSHLKLTDEDIAELKQFRAHNEARQKWKVIALGIFLTAITFAGALLGYVRAYNRFFREKGIRPNFYPMRPITKYAMKWGAIIMWGIVIGVLLIVIILFAVLGYRAGAVLGLIWAYLLSNFMACLVVYGIFKAWKYGVKQTLTEGNKFGSARFANADELQPYMKGQGFYIGDGLHFKDKGHILTVAGTRGGKGRDVIIPNLLGAANIECSWVVIDPKAENLIITSDWQRESGQNVVILNPWHLFTEQVGASQSYNPLDLLSDTSSPNLVDDVAVIAEMIVPVAQNDKNAFFSDGARMIVAGLLLHLITSEPKETRTLKTLWEWVRKVGEDWDKLIQDMAVNSDPVNGDTVSNAANEITKLSDSGSETFGSIISNILQATDFLKSTAMQQSLQSGFDPQILTEGRTTVYVVIPADKLRSHARWLRLVVTSMMRAVIRKPKNRVCFLLDEFAALGYLPEIETALSTYAGYNITVWPILQSLIQLKNLYRDNWESFIANSAVRQYFSIKDNFSADYISKAAGETSNVLVSRSWFGVTDAESNHRPLMTPDEIRLRSGKDIFLFINELPITMVQKVAYFVMEVVKDRAKKNPYIQI